MYSHPGEQTVVCVFWIVSVTHKNIGFWFLCRNFVVSMVVVVVVICVSIGLSRIRGLLGFLYVLASQGRPFRIPFRPTHINI